MIFGVDWRVRIVMVVGALVMLAGILFLDAVARLPVMFLGFGLVVAAFFLDKFLKNRAGGQS